MSERRASLVAEYKRLAAETEAAETAMYAEFEPLIRSALRQGNDEEARRLVSEIPGCVSKAFAMDMLRCARGEYGDAAKAKVLS